MVSVLAFQLLRALTPATYASVRGDTTAGGSSSSGGGSSSTRSYPQMQQYRAYRRRQQQQQQQQDYEGAYEGLGFQQAAVFEWQQPSTAASPPSSFSSSPSSPSSMSYPQAFPPPTPRPAPRSPPVSPPIFPSPSNSLPREGDALQMSEEPRPGSRTAVGGATGSGVDTGPSPTVGSAAIAGDGTARTAASPARAAAASASFAVVSDVASDMASWVVTREVWEAGRLERGSLGEQQQVEQQQWGEESAWEGGRDGEGGGYADVSRGTEGSTGSSRAVFAEKASGWGGLREGVTSWVVTRGDWEAMNGITPTASDAYRKEDQSRVRGAIKSSDQPAGSGGRSAALSRTLQRGNGDGRAQGNNGGSEGPPAAGPADGEQGWRRGGGQWDGDTRREGQLRYGTISVPAQGEGRRGAELPRTLPPQSSVLPPSLYSSPPPPPSSLTPPPSSSISSPPSSPSIPSSSLPPPPAVPHRTSPSPPPRPSPSRSPTPSLLDLVSPDAGFMALADSNVEFIKPSVRARSLQSQQGGQSSQRGQQGRRGGSGVVQWGEGRRTEGYERGRQGGVKRGDEKEGESTGTNEEDSGGGRRGGGGSGGTGGVSRWQVGRGQRAESVDSQEGSQGIRKAPTVATTAAGAAAAAARARAGGVVDSLQLSQQPLESAAPRGLSDTRPRPLSSKGAPAVRQRSTPAGTRNPTDDASEGGSLPSGGGGRAGGGRGRAEGRGGTASTSARGEARGAAGEDALRTVLTGLRLGALPVVWGISRGSDRAFEWAGNIGSNSAGREDPRVGAARDMGRSGDMAGASYAQSAVIEKDAVSGGSGVASGLAGEEGEDLRGEWRERDVWSSSSSGSTMGSEMHSSGSIAREESGGKDVREGVEGQRRVGEGREGGREREDFWSNSSSSAASRAEGSSGMMGVHQSSGMKDTDDVITGSRLSTGTGMGSDAGAPNGMSADVVSESMGSGVSAGGSEDVSASVSAGSEALESQVGDTILVTLHQHSAESDSEKGDGSVEGNMREEDVGAEVRADLSEEESERAEGRGEGEIRVDGSEKVEEGAGNMGSQRGQGEEGGSGDRREGDVGGEQRAGGVEESALLMAMNRQVGDVGSSEGGRAGEDFMKGGSREKSSGTVRRSNGWRVMAWGGEGELEGSEEGWDGGKDAGEVKREEEVEGVHRVGRGGEEGGIVLDDTATGMSSGVELEEVEDDNEEERYARGITDEEQDLERGVDATIVWEARGAVTVAEQKLEMGNGGPLSSRVPADVRASESDPTPPGLLAGSSQRRYERSRTDEMKVNARMISSETLLPGGSSSASLDPSLTPGGSSAVDWDMVLPGTRPRSEAGAGVVDTSPIGAQVVTRLGNTRAGSAASHGVMGGAGGVGYVGAADWMVGPEQMSSRREETREMVGDGDWTGGSGRETVRVKGRASQRRNAHWVPGAGTLGIPSGRALALNDTVDVVGNRFLKVQSLTTNRAATEKAIKKAVVEETRKKVEEQRNARGQEESGGDVTNPWDAFMWVSDRVYGSSLGDNSFHETVLKNQRADDMPRFNFIKSMIRKEWDYTQDKNS